MTALTIASYTRLGVDLTSKARASVSITGRGVVNANASYRAAVYGALGVVGTVLNSGTLKAASGFGVVLTSGGTVVNGGKADHRALISVARYAIRTQSRGAGYVTNFGTIVTTNNSTDSIGITLGGGGTATNGSVDDTGAQIHSYQSGIVSLGPHTTVANFGTIVTTGVNNASYGVYLRAGGRITNGSNADRAATILSNARGVSAGTYRSTIVNYGTIDIARGGKADVILLEGGKVVNGSSIDTSARLQAASAGRCIYIKGPSASRVVNFGTISGGISMRPGGTVINGSNLDPHARIVAALYGVSLQGPIASVVLNYGTIIASQQKGLILSAGGTVVNGSAHDRSAYLSGRNSIYAGGTARSSLTNFGTIAANGGSTSDNVAFLAGGKVVNGSSTDRTAAIVRGQVGIVIVNGSGTISNAGTITGNTAISFYRVTGAGVTMTAAGTVINAGTIRSLDGTSGTAIRFGGGTGRLVMDPGSVIIGRVVRGTGSNTLELAAGGPGTLAGLGTSLAGFARVMVDSGSSWTLTGTNSVDAGATLTDAGSVLVDGVFVNRGSVGGDVTLAAGATLANYGTFGAAGANRMSQTGLDRGNLVFDGGNATVRVAKSAVLTATISGIGSTDTIDFMGTVAHSLSFAGGRLRVIGAGGAIAVLEFAGSYGAGNFSLKSDGLGGTDLVTVGLIPAIGRSGLAPFPDLRPGSVQQAYPVGNASLFPSSTHEFAGTPSDWALSHQFRT